MSAKVPALFLIVCLGHVGACSGSSTGPSSDSGAVIAADTGTSPPLTEDVSEQGDGEAHSKDAGPQNAGDIITDCGDGEYEVSPATETSDVVCAPITACTEGEYEATPATETTDAVCAPITACAEGEYEATPATETTDAVCAPITACAEGEYEATPATETTDAVCELVTECTDAEYEVSGSTDTSDTVCAPITICDDDEYETTAATETTDAVCAPITVCAGGEYEATIATATTDTVCEPVTGCTDAEYEAAPATDTSDTVCEPVTGCTDAEYETAPATATTDTVCVAMDTLPAWIEAEDYGAGGAGVHYHDASPGNDGEIYRQDDVDISAIDDGFVVTMQSGEWLGYPIYAAQSTTYRLTLWATSDVVGRHLSVLIDGIEVALRLPVPTSAQAISLGPVYLNAGAHTLHILGGVHDGVVVDALALDLPPCTDVDMDGYCAEDGEDCRDDDGLCFTGVCCRTLAGHWPFDETEGAVATDVSGNENDGELSTVQQAPWTEGVMGGALSFDGETQVAIPNSASLEVGKTYTWAGWFKTESEPTGRLWMLRNQTDAWGFFSSGAFQFRASHTASGSWPAYAIDGEGEHPLGTWHHVAFVTSDTEVQIYLNGVLDAGKHIDPYDASSQDLSFLIGCLPGTPPSWLACTSIDGLMDDVRLYDDALTAGEVAELYMMAPHLVSACSDGLDNDGDGLTDVGHDPACTSAFDDTEGTDITAPTTPQDLVLVAAELTMNHLSWAESTDDIALSGYNVYRDGRRIDTVMRPTYHDTGTDQGMSYTYTVSAMDHGGIESPVSEPLVVETPTRPVFPGAETITVSPDDFAGYDSLHALVAGSPEGTTFVLEPGLYRMAHPMVPRAGQSIIGKTGVILSGAIEPEEGDITLVDDLYMWPGHNISDLTCQEPGTCVAPEGTSCATSEEITCADLPVVCRLCRQRHDLFFDDQRLTRVGTKEEVVAGTFYTDYVGGDSTVWFADDPDGHTVELAITRNAINGTPNTDDCDPDCNAHVTVRGLIIEKFATVAQRGAIMAKEKQYTGAPMRYWTVEQNEIRWNHGFGVYSGSHSIMRDNHIHHNGHMGGTVGSYSLMEGNEFAHNGGVNYLAAWSAGAFKIVGNHYTLVQGNYVHDNIGHGMWVDINNYDIVLEHNVTSDNHGDGIKYEISYDAIIRRNTGLGNYHRDGAGWMWGSFVLVQNSEGCEVYDNQIELGAEGNGINIPDQDRTYDGKAMVGVGNVIHRNWISHTAGTGRNGYQNPDNVFDLNVYIVPNAYNDYFGANWHWFQAAGYEAQGDLFVMDPVPEATYAAPTATWTSPGDGTSVECPAEVPLQLTAQAVQRDAITRVEFLVDGAAVGQTSNPPYTVPWFSPTSGDHTLHAVVSTMRGQQFETPAVTVTVNCP